MEGKKFLLLFKFGVLKIVIFLTIWPGNLKPLTENGLTDLILKLVFHHNYSVLIVGRDLT